MDRLLLMVRFIEELSKLNVPVVFKGAIVLKTALTGINLTTTRETRDVDGDWVGGTPTVSSMCSVLNVAANAVKPGMYVVVDRAYDVNKSAGFSVYNNDKSFLFEVDLSVRSNPFSCAYLSFNGVSFVGATLQKMFSDKLHAVSGRVVLRRIKDVYDLFLLSALVGYRLSDVYNILNVCGRRLGDFSVFLSRYTDLAHAYNKFHGIDNKPEFDIIYNRVKLFIGPFISRQTVDAVWTGCNWAQQEGSYL